MDFEIGGEISGIETIAVGSKIRDHQTPSEALWQRAVTKTERHCLDPLAQRTHPIGRTALVRGARHWEKGNQAQNAIWIEDMKRGKHDVPLFAVE
jgi:hypothetical protein